MKFHKRDILVFSIGVLLTLAFAPTFKALVSAEQSGDTPNSGATSYIKELYDSLVSSSFGSDSSGSWGDWGSSWNRIRSAGEWVPDGTATVDQVLQGSIFYSDSRTQLTGTAQLQQDFELQAVIEWDDYESPDYNGEESIWTNTLPLSGGEEVWKDERTGLYWSHNLLKYTSSFSNEDHSDCPFFDGSTKSEKLTARYGYDGLTTECGNAINVCGSLELDADGDGVDETNWYLPTQKELMQAYLDGINNQAGSSFTTEEWFASSTEVGSIPFYVWFVYMGDGSTGYVNKTTSLDVRCVSRG